MGTQLQLSKIKHGLLQMLCAKSSKLELVRAFANLTLRDIFEASPPSLVTIAQRNGLQTAEMYTSLILADLSTSFDGELGQDAVMEIAAEINATYLRNLTLEDIYLMCSEIKRSQVFGKLTVNKVLKYAVTYFETRCNEAARLSLEQFEQYRHGDAQRSSSSEQTMQHTASLYDITRKILPDGTNKTTENEQN